MIHCFLFDVKILQVFVVSAVDSVGRGGVLLPSLVGCQVVGGTLVGKEEEVLRLTDGLVTRLQQLEKHFGFLFNVAVSVLWSLESDPVLFVNI